MDRNHDRVSLGTSTKVRQFPHNSRRRRTIGVGISMAGIAHHLLSQIEKSVGSLTQK